MSESRLEKELEEFGDMVPESVVSAARALIAEHRAELARARAEAMERAEDIANNMAHNCGVAAAVMTTEPNRRAWLKAQEMSADIAQSIRSLITTPVPASIPVEKVREVVDTLSGEEPYTAYPAARKFGLTLLKRLDVDLDASWEACGKCYLKRETCEDCASCPECGLLGAHKVQWGRRA